MKTIIVLILFLIALHVVRVFAGVTERTAIIVVAIAVIAASLSRT